MRDIFVTLVSLGALPFCLLHPSIGVLLYSWLSYMNPHRLTWGFAYDFPFAQLAAIATIAGIFVSRDTKRFPFNATVIVWILLLLWMTFTTFFAFVPDDAWEGFNKVAKIQLMTFITLYVMGSRDRIRALVWVIALSLAFYGVKGGIFGIVTGGQYRVWGPAGSFIEDNNSLALALIMVLPLLRFLQQHASSRYIKLGLTGCMALTGVAVLASQSRGALLGLCAMAAFFFIKSRNKFLIMLIIILSAPAAYQFMPQSWHDRMGTIETYEEDGSAMGRITVWRYTFELANHRLVGGGFRGIETDVGYQRYAPDIYAEVINTHGHFRAAHSIWFGMLGQHGWPGLILFFLLGWFAWRNGSWVIRHSRGDPDLVWCRDLAAMLQVSIVGYASTGTFLSMEYFDLFFHVVALLVLLQAFVKDHIRVTAEQPDDAKIQDHDEVGDSPSPDTVAAATGR